MKIVNGDLIKLAEEGKFDIISHGCNCMCMMGLGIAKTIRGKYPQVYQADLKTIRGDKNKLGTIVGVNCGKFDIVNAYTQYRGGKNLDYNALENCLKEIKIKYSGKRIGLPQIGCGIAGGDWDKIKQMIEYIFIDEDITVVIYCG